MENFNIVRTEIRDQLNNINYRGDLSDLGNEIGIVLGKFITTTDELKDFINGINHGISLTKGTHP